MAAAFAPGAQAATVCNEGGNGHRGDLVATGTPDPPPPARYTMRLSLRVLMLLVVAVGLSAAATASGRKGGQSTKAAPSGCTVKTYSYDSGGSPGSGVVNDPLFPKQWGLQQIHAPSAWARGAK